MPACLASLSSSASSQHGIKRVWVEGLTPSDMPAFGELIKQTKTVEADIPQLQEMLARSKGLKDSERASQEILGLLDEQRQRRLQIGASGQLLMAGELAEIIPLDDDQTHAAANPLRKNKVVLSSAEFAAREEAMAARLSSSDDSVSVIVLGAAHDLGRPLERRGVEYRRLVSGRVKQLVDGLE